MKKVYPPEVQAKVDFLDKYVWSDDLDEFNLFHLYPQELAASDTGTIHGYVDSRFFNLVGYNFAKMQRRNLGKRDELCFCSAPSFSLEECSVNIVRVFADGSTLIRFNRPVKVDLFQSVDVYPAGELE